jgi:hypothetical protein
MHVHLMVPPRKVTKPSLEILSSTDRAWYDGDISLEGPRVRVHFDGFGSNHDEFLEGDYLQRARKLLKTVRLRSKQLQDSECNKVDVGTIVCANYKTPDGTESRYYDARMLMVSFSII